MKITTTITIIACTIIIAVTTVFVVNKWSEHKRAEMVTEELGNSVLGQLLSKTPEELEESIHRGNNRGNCILNIRNMQQAVRSHANDSGLNPDDPSELSDIIGVGKYMETAPTCPSGGTYTWIDDRIPKIGELIIDCSIEDHIPAQHSDW